MKSKTLMVLALSLTFATAYAQSDERVLNSDPINVDGYLADERPVTDGELEQIKHEIRKQKNEVILNKEKTKGFKELSKTTEKLSETTEEYLDEKKDAQKEISEYNARIKCLMDEHPGKECDKYVKNRKEQEEPAPVVQEVAVAQAAPAAQVSVTEVETGPNLDKPFEEIKLIPVVGSTHYEGDKESLDATFSGGLRLESNINKRFSMGMGFNYSQLSTQDFANSSYSNYYNPVDYYGAYGNKGREIKFSTMGIEFYGKFFITRGERFRPYIGGGLGYNQASMNYTQNNTNTFYSNYYNSSYNYGNENYKTSYGTGRIMVGTEVMITRGIGLMIEAGYMTGLGGGISSKNAQSTSNSPDQRRLQQLGKDIINSNALSVLAGAVVVF